ncbi:unnamed protein product [Chironomus riparius]|uniref:Ubiquitin carboxyl-terminal hydrolase n=1 Tax=Chironomus riparius TaxID=315576 RepID=A0A9N9WUC3_9DIPT|nr:unnamed protein product [Chironomus riparius]
MSSNGSSRTLKEIDNEVEKVKDLVKGKTIQQICISAKKLAEMADFHDKKGDAETAYICLGRYMNLLTQLQHKKDYVAQKNFIRTTMGGNQEQKRLMEKLEKLREKLKPRIINEENIAKMTIEPKVPVENPVIDKIPEIRETITCLKLFEMMEKDSSKILIIDTRSNEDFINSKIDFKFICNVPQDLCNLGMTANKIQLELPNESKVFWEMRKDRPIIVFLDWRSVCFTRNTPVWQLRNILKEYDPELDKIPEMIILEGGYESWLFTYPMKCTDPHVEVPNDMNNSTPTVEGIEYPTLEDIVMKDESFSTPLVDRSTKGSAIKAYDKKLSESELLEEKEILINKSIQNEKDLMKLEQDFDIMSANKENEDDPNKQQQMLFQIWELDTKQKDFASQHQTINNELEKVKKTTILSPKISKVEDLEKRLKVKEAEEKKLHDDREKKKKEREEKLSIARQNKPQFDDYKSPTKAPRKSELILSPRNLNQNSIPHFDRASKPTLQNSQLFYDNQDFAPVYQKVERGLTGLKNLGNTCYMNSIIQCLSHTLSLKQYLLENDYEKQINRSNNTKGHIVRTLAAVIKMLWSGECKYISSKHLKSVIGEQEHLFCGFDQQDAHEFLVMLIDWLQSDLQTINMANNIGQSPPSEKAWLEYTKAKESFILRLFYGQIKSTVKCKVCGEESATFDTFSNLSLELPMINIERCHIMDCFNLYFNGENISGWNCPRCKVPRDAIKKLDISKLPPVLIIHLKRFYADSYSFRKKSIYVEFPYADLDMLQYVSPKERMSVSGTNHVYNLYAVSNHYGTMESGHYTAFCRNARQNKWYKFDDHNVTQIDKSDVKSSATYILFYTYLPESRFIN